ncbi:MAG: hypothetical protein JXX29_12145 [Deltaproteobacteria bacterium]|nr:hypothetical protein [Deltaproteobacteria bacterium]MBN2672424.1 hypothetical protein [Deltaproteobacteria bacterium]
MFWKLIEIIVRVLYWRRFAKAKKIGEAAAMLTDGKPQEALAHLERHGTSVHQTLIPLFALTQAKIYQALGRLEEAENSFKAVVLTNPRDSRADLELAVLTGRQFRFDDCRTWLNRAIEKKNPEIKAQAKGFLQHLDAIEDGSKQREYETRAKKMADQPLPDGQTLGLPPNRSLMNQWLGTTADAMKAIDDLALLLAYAEVVQGGQWKIGLAIEDVTVIRPDGETFLPYEVLAPMLPSQPTSATALVSSENL